MMQRMLVRSVAALFTIISLVWVVIWLRSDQPRTVTALFENSTGLYEGNAVSVLGVRIGTVRKITVMDEYVEVVLTLERNIDLPADVQAVTVATSVLTDRHIELTPPYSGGPKLQDGDVVGLGHTRTPVEFDQTMAMVDKLSRSLQGEGNGEGPLARLIAIGSRVSSNNSGQIRDTLGELSNALRLGSDSGARSKENIRAVISNLAALTEAASENDTVIRKFGTNVRQLSEILADEQLGSGSTGKQINGILGDATRLLEQNRENLTATMSDAQVVTTAIAEYRRELAETLDLAPLTADNVYNAIDDKAGSLRVHGLIDKVLFNGQMTKEVCNLMGLRQLGCSTGTLADYGPDFGLTSMLDLMAQTS